ncbi:SIR2 family protein [Loigolactobacillus coryniformis]|uniref:SIR2 family protein n=1 Tax=Loigolactobacillus coryniformis TaxID=1610 RepID=UPI003F20179F
MDELQPIRTILKEADSLPFLFVGSGMSKRYLNIPTWNDLLAYVASLINPDKYYFAKLERQISDKINKKTNYNQYMTALCDLVQDELNALWYTSNKFVTSRDKYGDLVIKNDVQPIKVEIARYIGSFDNTTPSVTDELNCLKNISSHSIAGIITTNYDNLLENIFNFQTYTSQEELLFHSRYELAEIYKIHGSISNPETILINSNDYKEIENKHKYISAKLLTIFVEHPVFFLGYSIGDQDIRLILRDIIDSLGTDQAKDITKRFFFVTWDSEVDTPKISDSTITFSNGRTLTMTQIIIKDYISLYKLLAETKIKYPVKMLRYIKEDLYNYTLSNTPTKKAAFWIPDKELTKEEQSQVEFMYGFGIIERAENGYDSIHYEEFYEDVVFDNKNFQNHLVVEKSLPIALRACSGWMPIRKYVKDIDLTNVPSIVDSNLSRFYKLDAQLSWRMKKEIKKNGRPTLKQALESKADKLLLLAKVDWNKDNIEVLGDFLRRTLKPNDEFHTTTNTRRLIRIYDFVKYQ